MPLFSRRAFLGALATALPTASLIRRAHAAAVEDIVAIPRTLRALGEAVLPSELGEARIAATVTDFQRWIAGYREGAELLHGYGTSTLRHAGPTSATRWAAQLAALDASARREWKRSFASLGVNERRTIVQASLDAIKADRIVSVGQAPHVALALLGHYYASAEATDLCYRARIEEFNCRPLNESPRKPLRIAQVGT